MAGKIKVLGLNFGRINGECKKYLNIALEEAKAAGAETEIIDTVTKKINRCIGCGACSRMLESGKQQIRCIQKDDYEAISDAVLYADCIIVAAPVYVLGPVGQLKDFVDRFGPAHDKAYMLFENAKREDTEGDVPLEKRCLKRHLVSYISIGGAATDHWVSFGLNQLNLFGMSINMKVVDQMNAHGMWRSQELTDQTVADAKHMGRRIVEAYSKKNSEITWESDPGVCPVCHCNEMTLNGTDTVCCPVCGIYGTLKMDGHKVKVTFTEEEQNRSRLRLAGVLEHQVELGRKPRYGDKFDEYLERFKAQEDIL